MSDKKPLRIIRRGPATEQTASRGPSHRPRAKMNPRPQPTAFGAQRFFATCPRGLEPLLAEDLAAVDASDIREVPGGVHFQGDWRTC